MLLGARQFFERRCAPTPPIPYDAEVEYLESTGTQWIDTGIIPNPDIGFVLSAAYTGYAPGYGRLFGTQKDGYAASIVVRQSQASSGEIYLQKYGGTGGVVSTIPFDTDKHIYRLNYPDNSVSVDTTKWTYTSFTSSFTGSCWLWGNNNVTSGFAKARIYGLQVVSRETGNDVANFIPVRFTNELGQSEGAMYDRVSGALFRNSGTGAFVIGPDKS